MKRIVIILSVILLGCQENKTVELPERWQAIGKLLISETEIILDTTNFEQAIRKTVLLCNPTEQDVRFRVLEEGEAVSMFRVKGGKEIPAGEAFTLRGGALATFVVEYDGRAPESLMDYEENMHFEVNGDTLVTGFYVGRKQW